MWGSTNCNDGGVALLEFLNSTNLGTLNQGNDPTFCNSRRLEVTDITLGSFRLLESIKGWKVSSEPSLSDHRYVLLNVEGSVLEHLFRNPRGTNWDSFQGDLGSKLQQGLKMNMKDEAGLGLTIHHVQQALISAYEDNCPL